VHEQRLARCAALVCGLASRLNGFSWPVQKAKTHASQPQAAAQLSLKARLIVSIIFIVFPSFCAPIWLPSAANECYCSSGGDKLN